MKKILSLLGTSTLIVTGTISLVACDKTKKYTEKELVDLKEKNNIKTKDGILEWIIPQEKPFNQVDNKYYYVIWKKINEKLAKFLEIIILMSIKNIIYIKIITMN